jgi:hypothetical protein
MSGYTYVLSGHQVSVETDLQQPMDNDLLGVCHHAWRAARAGLLVHLCSDALRACGVAQQLPPTAGVRSQ